MVDLAENSYVFAGDLHFAGAGRSGFSFGLGGRGARLSTGGPLWGHWVAAAHKVAAFASDAFDIDIRFWFRLDGLRYELGSHLQDIGVKRSRQALVSANHHQQDGLF